MGDAADETSDSLAAEARALCLRSTRGSLATHLARDDQPGVAPGFPYVSLVLVAWDQAPGRPPAALFLLSDLADHTRNIKRRGEAALLLDGTAGFAEPLAGPRVTLLGSVAASAAESDRTTFLTAHPGASVYAGFADFRLYRLEPAVAHFVAGFGRIAWLQRSALAGA